MGYEIYPFDSFCWHVPEGPTSLLSYYLNRQRLGIRKGSWDSEGNIFLAVDREPIDVFRIGVFAYNLAIAVKLLVFPKELKEQTDSNNLSVAGLPMGRLLGKPCQQEGVESLCPGCTAFLGGADTAVGCSHQCNGMDEKGFSGHDKGKKYAQKEGREGNDRPWMLLS